MLKYVMSLTTYTLILRSESAFLHACSILIVRDMIYFLLELLPLSQERVADIEEQPGFVETTLELEWKQDTNVSVF